jgi:ATP phosphoribosyltransferase
MLRIAVAKGRTAKEVLKLLSSCGIFFDDFETSRKLILKSRDNNFEIILVKPIDTPVYVESGAADCGIAGYDVLLENEADVNILMNLNIGKCKMCVAAKKDTDTKNKKFITAATKFPNIAKKYFDNNGIDCKIIKLSGAIELSPLLNMSDAIVDIVQTGKTLAENGLEIKDIIISDISACLIANKVSLKTNYPQIEGFMTKLKEASDKI